MKGSVWLAAESSSNGGGGGGKIHAHKYIHKINALHARHS